MIKQNELCCVCYQTRTAHVHAAIRRNNKCIQLIPWTLSRIIHYNVHTKKVYFVFDGPEITTKLISFNTIRYIHCSLYVIKPIQKKRMHWITFLRTQTVTAIVIVIVIDFTIGHNQLYIRQNGNTIWTYSFILVFILLSTHVTKIASFLMNGIKRADGWRPEKEEKEEEEEMYTGREARENKNSRLDFQSIYWYANQNYDRQKGNK